MKILSLKIGIYAFLFSIILTSSSVAEPRVKVDSSSRCSVCGMFVAKYPAWVAQVHHKSGRVELFDGVKDMMVYVFHPERYGAKSGDDIDSIWVKDYYTLSYIDAKDAYYVIGSDVYGPMGHEFIPFQKKEAAKAFMKDHKGKEIVAYGAVSESMVEAMRSGNTMK